MSIPARPGNPATGIALVIDALADPDTRQALDNLSERLESKSGRNGHEVRLTACGCGSPTWTSSPGALRPSPATPFDCWCLSRPSTKSELLSHWTPVWFLANWPSGRIGLASYAADFAETWGRKARDSVAENELSLGIRVRDDLNRASEWELATGGGMMTAGVGGPFTGRGFDLIIIDDPLKNRQEANSPTVRRHLWEWWRSTARTRLRPSGSIIVVATRWHEEDLIGKLMEAMTDGEGDFPEDRWEHIRLPALAEAGDPLAREADAPLWPGRYDADTLAATRLAVGPQEWAGLYQQRPAPIGGAVFRTQDFRYYRKDEEAETFALMNPEGTKHVPQAECHRFVTVDTATSLRERADYTVAATWAVTKDRDLLLLDLVRTRLETPDITPLVGQVYARWQPAYIGVEGKAVFQVLRRAGLPVRELKPDADKWTRAQPAAARLASGTVYFPAAAPWLPEFEDELVTFPNGAHDDQVDCLAYAALEVARGRGRTNRVRAWG